MSSAKRRSGAPARSPPNGEGLRKRWAWIAVVVIAAVPAVFWYVRTDSGATAVTTSGTPARSPGPQFLGRIGSTHAADTVAERAARLQELTRDFELVDRTYCSYRARTRYPIASRPVAEHPDQVYPNRPVTETHDMRTGGGHVDSGVKIQTSQSRVFMAAGEGVAFSVRAVDTEGNTLALVVTRAVAQGVTFKGARETPQLALAFADDGQGADPVAGDGAFAAVLAPAQTSLAGFNGTIRTEVRYNVGGRAGVLLFDVIYTAEAPAIWTGQVREAVEAGSLNFYLKAEMRQAGRYIVTGRVDDANGRPFALATFNDVLNAGSNEVRLTVFGKLMRDQQPTLPLTLRDVDGYLLKENTDPDRALMPRLEGKAYVSKPHPLENFSDAEWQSEERTRYLTEYGKDLNLAKAAFAEFDPAQPLPASQCADSR
jgi:hypothetical protein